MKISADFFQLANRSISRWTQYCPPLQSLSISIKCMSAVRKLWKSMLTMTDGAGKERCFHWQHEIRISGLTFRGRHIIIICYSMYMIIFCLEYHLIWPAPVKLFGCVDLSLWIVHSIFHCQHCHCLYRPLKCGMEPPRESVLW